MTMGGSRHRERSVAIQPAGGWAVAMTENAPMLNTAFSPWPSFSAQEADAVRDVLLSNKVNYWTGQECRAFE